MKSILENIVNNTTLSVWIFRFEQITIYTLYKTSNSCSWIGCILEEKPLAQKAICIQAERSGMPKELPNSKILIYPGNKIRSMAKGHYSEKKKELCSFQQFQAFPPKCNIQLVYGKGRRHVDLFFYLNESRNL